IQAYDGKKFCNVTTDDLGLESEKEKEDAKTESEESKELLGFVKDTLGDKVTAVRLSHKLRNHAVLLTSDGNISIEMEKYFMSTPGADDQKVKANRVLELNSKHPAFKALTDAYVNDKDRAARMSKIMYDQAVIVAGLPLEDTVEYSDLVFGLF
ncbi:MAG: molecular chaperone HtpG, partial [Candidatus Methanomethylophilaceae archaeon]